MIKIRKICSVFISVLLFAVICFWFFPKKAFADEDPVIIVIDPGHGGKNLGAQYDGYVEKDMTMITARAMKEELELYQNVIVYLTHETDTDMSIKARANFADEKNADFLFCLHYNSSENHNFYGAEVWIPAYGSLYAEGRCFAEIEMEELADMGLYSRGIKTRLNDKDEDYYGILRYCSELGIPSALIEHCHLDHNKDKVFYQGSTDQLEAFGRADAEAVAKYLGLISPEKGTDYSSYPRLSFESSEEPIRPDKSIPDMCEIKIQELDETEGKITVTIEAWDHDSYIQYYSYSLDGGKTFSDLEPWPRPVWHESDPEHVFTADIPFEKELELCVNVYNGFDVFTESNHINIESISLPEEEAPSCLDISPEILPDPVDVPEEESGKMPDRGILVLMLVLIGLLMVIVFLAMVRMIFRLRGSNKRQKKQ